MKAKTILLGLLILVLLLCTGAIVLVAATGFVQIPVLNSLLGTDKARDLGVKSDPAAFDGMLEKNGVELTSPKAKYCLNCNIAYSNAGPMDVTLTSAELTSYLQSTNDQDGTLKNIQVKLGSNNQLEASALVDLKKYGQPWAGPVYAKGTIQKSGSNSIKLNLEKGEAGLVPIPGEYSQKGAVELEKTINDQLAGMTGLTIDELSIDNGQLHYEGNFPKKMGA